MPYFPTKERLLELRFEKRTFDSFFFGNERVTKYVYDAFYKGNSSVTFQGTVPEVFLFGHDAEYESDSDFEKVAEILSRNKAEHNGYSPTHEDMASIEGCWKDSGSRSIAWFDYSGWLRIKIPGTPFSATYEIGKSRYVEIYPNSKDELGLIVKALRLGRMRNTRV